MFRFNFRDDDEEYSESDGSKTGNEVQWYESKEVMIPLDASEKVKSINKSHIVNVNYADGISCLCLSANEVIKTLKPVSGSEFTDAIKADEQHSDLLPGRYEGGLKTWECTEDLAIYFVQNIIVNKNSGSLRGKSVLDLGCGSGILGIISLQRDATVVFQDYNEEVLIAMTIPNVCLNSDNGELSKKAKFYSGDWSSFAKSLQGNEKDGGAGRFDYILTSETIYNPDNYWKLIRVFRSLLKQNGVALVAAKSNYFGVGGTMHEFKSRLEANDFVCDFVWETTEGVSRQILDVRRRP